MADATAETATETTTTETTAETETETVESLRAEAEKWKAQSRKNEDRAKEHSKRLRELETEQRAQMSDAERALAEARDQGRSAALVEVGSRLVDAEIRVAAAGRTIDVDALLEGLDRSKFLTDAGEPDSTAVTAWIDKLAPATTETETTPTRGPLDLGQGTRQQTPIGDDDALTRDLKAAIGAK
jgi:hypothetical protein